MRMLVTAVALGLCTGAGAQTGESGRDCAGVTAVLPAELAGWSGAVPRNAAASAEAASGVALTVGQAARLRLVPVAGLRHAVRPEKPGGPGSHGGLAGFTVERAGVYRVALGSAAWVDVVRGGMAATSIAHGHGPACSGIRKIVNFRLSPGRYLLQVAGSGEPVVAVMVAFAPGTREAAR